MRPRGVWSGEAIKHCLTGAGAGRMWKPAAQGRRPNQGRPGYGGRYPERTEGESPRESVTFMAKITFTPGWDHVHGHVGTFVYRERYGEDILGKLPDVVHQPNTPAQLAVRDDFRQAAAWAKGAMQDPQVHDAYAARARELHSSPTAVAVTDWMKAPTVTAIDLTGYTKHIGDVISVAAQDDFAVTGVVVAIEDSAHLAVESGAATFDAASGSWKYTATVDASAKSGLTVTATASDRPGNTGELTATK
jgi:hypothetical protein